MTKKSLPSKRLIEPKAEYFRGSRAGKGLLAARRQQIIDTQQVQAEGFCRGRCERSLY